MLPLIYEENAVDGDIDTFIKWRGGGISTSRVVEARPICRGCAGERSVWGTDDLVRVSVPKGAHIFDLAGAHAGDTVGVREARDTIIEVLASWLA